MEAAKFSTISRLLSVFCEVVKTQEKVKYFCRDYQRDCGDDCIQVERVAKTLALVGIVQTTMNDGVTKKNIQCVYTDGHEMIKETHELAQFVKFQQSLISSFCNECKTRVYEATEVNEHTGTEIDVGWQKRTIDARYVVPIASRVVECLKKQDDLYGHEKERHHLVKM